MLVVAALGGNALLRRGDPADAPRQRDNARRAASALAALTCEHALVVTHGNGPQVGLLAMQSESTRGVGPYPLDVVGAESEGMIGYVLEQELANQLPERDVVTLLTQVVVDPADPAFRHPTKPIGAVYDEAEAQRLAAERGWTVARDGDRWRRVVPSPTPLDVVELRAIDLLVQAGVVVVCAGGGGIPIVVGEGGTAHGVEAVVDKDRASALLASRLGADALLLLTDVDGVYRGWATPAAERLDRVDAASVAELALPEGSMGPKVEAGAWFVRRTGGFAAIGALDDAAAVLAGTAGTRIVASGRVA